jgi:hypothetical protein
MNNVTQALQTVPLSTMGGLVTIAKPNDLPEGASPRTYDTDFDVGSVKTRAGLLSKYAYSSGSAGPSPGGTAVDTSLGGFVWNNPTNVLTNTGNYATASLPGYTSVESVQIVDSGFYISPTSVSFRGSGPGGATGTVQMTAVLGGYIVAGVTITNPGQYTGPVTVTFGATFARRATGTAITEQISSSTDALDVSQLGFSLPSTATPQGFAVNVEAFATASVTLDVQLLKAGVPVGTAQSLTPGTSVSTLIFGGVNNLFGASWLYSDLNSTIFGVRITASGNNAATVSVGYVTLQVYYLPQQANFTWIGSFLPQNGQLQNIACDADGNLWLENVESAPGVLTLLRTNIAMGAHGFGITADNAELMAFSDLTQGIDLPLQYRNGWIDRISQVGPGAGPSFIGSATQGSVATATAYSYSAGILTITAANSFTAGEVITINAGAADALFALNGLVFNVLGTGLSSSAFEIAETAVTGSGATVATAVPQFTFPILAAPVGVTQYPFWNSAQGYQSQLDGVMWNAGPGSPLNSAGNVVTVYYLDAFNYQQGADINLVNAFQSGQAVYVYVSGTAIPIANGVQQVTGIGIATPPGASTERYYFTFNVASLGSAISGASVNGAPGQYQLTVATVTTAVPVPGLQIGSTATLSGVGVSNWNAAWTVTNTPNSGTYAILSTQLLTGGVGQYQYAVDSGAAPVPGQLITVTGTFNENGIFNVTDALIATVTGGTAFTVSSVTLGTAIATIQATNTLSAGNTGVFAGLTGSAAVLNGLYFTVLANGLSTSQFEVEYAAVSPGGPYSTGGTFTVGASAGYFTIAGFSGTAQGTSVAEQGIGESAGNQFQFDPGAAAVGTITDVIYGNSGGGYVTLVGSTVQVVGTGTRQGVVFFITRNGYWTCPSPPVTFTTAVNVNYILVSNIAIGPPDVIGRGIAFTEGGQLGVPGANFFTIPQQVEFEVFNTTYTSSSLIIWDNVTTSAQFTFTDAVLLNAEAIDIEGNNLFNLIELGNPAWMAEYDSRIFYGLCQNKIQNFLNLSFDGGYLPTIGGANIAPLGWNLDPASNSLGATATIQVSPAFGNSYYIQNTTGSTQAILGMIYQSAYQDFYQQPILNAGGLQTLYSVRVTARCPSGLTTGNLVIDLVNLTSSGYGASFGSFTLPFASMASNLKTYTGTLVTTAMATVPPGLVLRYYVTEIGNLADCEVDRIEVYPTLIPVENTVIYASYIQEPEAIDGVDGRIVSTNQNNQAVMGAVKLFNSLYLQKESSKYNLQSVPGQEPANWGEPASSAYTGACGIYAYDGASDNDTGENWEVAACRKGLYLYEGGQPGKICQEIQQVWDAINWNAGNSIWVRNDTVKRKLYVGVPLPTPNFWLPNAPANSAPTTPNVILMCNYQGIDSGEQLKTMPGIHVTMFGKLATLDMRRKWSIWQIASPYAGFVGLNRLDNSQLNICNGIGNSKVYTLNPTLTGQDDGNYFNSLYTTYGFVNEAKVETMPLLGYFRKRWRMLWQTLEGAGTLGPTLYPNTLIGPTDSTVGFYSWQMPVPFLLDSPAVQDSGTTLNFVAFRTFIEYSCSNGWFRLSDIRLSGTKDVWNELLPFGPFA